MNTSIRERSLDVDVLVKYLKGASEDQEFSYDELAALLRCDKTKARQALYSARRILQSQYRLVFDTIPTIGIKRLPNESIEPTVRAHSLKKIRRAARRDAKKLSCVIYENLSPQQQNTYNATISFVRFIQEVCTQTQVQKLETATVSKRAELPFGRILEELQK